MSKVTRYRKDNVNSMQMAAAVIHALVFEAWRAALFFSLIIKDSAVGFISDSPVLMVVAKRSEFMALVSGSASITEVSIHRG